MTPDSHRRAVGWIVLVALVVAMATIVPAPGASGQTFPSIGSIRTAAVSDDDLVVIAGDLGLAIERLDGTRLAVIPSIRGASVIDIRDGDAYVGDGFSSEVVVVDLATRQIETTIDLGVELRNDRALAVLSDSIWFLDTTGLLYRYDRTTGVSSRVTSVTGASVSITRSPGDDSRVLLTEFVGFNAMLSRVQTSPPFTVRTVTGYIQTQDLAPTDHDTIWATSGAGVEEIDVSSMTRVGVRIESGGDTLTTKIDWSPVAGGTVAWGTSSRVYVAPVGAAVQSHQFDPPCSVNDVHLAHAVPVLYITSGSACRNTFDLRPQLTNLSSTSAVAGVPQALTITGNGMGGTVGVAIDGTPLTPAANTPTTLRLDVPTTLAPGSHTLSVTNAWGTTSRTITVHPDLGAGLGGDVRRGTSVVAGAQLTLTSTALGAPLVTTSDVEGRYGFTGLPVGEYRLTLTDPSGVQAPQVVSQIDLVPNEQTELDLWLREEVTSSPTIARVQLPGGTIRAPAVAPGGRVLVPVGDELVVADVAGAVIGRIRGLPGVTDVEFAGGAWWATLSTGEFVRLDLDALRTVGRWLPGVTASTPGVPAGDRVWFVARVGTTSTFALHSLDPATGAVTAHPAITASGLRAVAGDDDLLAAYQTGGSSRTSLYDLSSGTPTLVSSTTDALTTHTFDADHGRIYAASGVESRLSDFTPTGVVYPFGAGSSATRPQVSSARGGIVTWGRNVLRLGAPAVTHVLPDASPIASGVHDPAGDRAFAVVGSTLTVTSLAPRLTPPTGTVAPEATTLGISGFGLGAATSARVDGQIVTVAARSASTVELLIAPLAPGPHTVDVTTPWGTSSPVVVTAAYTAPPVVTAVAPSQIPTAGGTVTLSGSGFTGATQVKAGGSETARSFTVVDDRTIVATFGPRFPTAMVITVTTPVGTSSSSTGPSLRWVAPQPVVTEVTPNAGSPLSRSVVTVRGSGLLYATAISVGGLAATINSVTDTEATVTLPIGTPGIAQVRVTTPGGTSADGAASEYTWDAALPHIGSLSESNGPISGGRLLALEGSALASVTEVWFGSTLAEHVVVDDDTVVAVTPPGIMAGAVLVRAVSATGSSAPTIGSRYTYVAQGTGSITGHVRSTSGPLAQMAVVLSGARDFGVLTYALTDADGRFEIPTVGAGEYRIVTLDPRILFGAPDHHIGEFYDDGGSTLDDFAASTPVVVSAGAATVLDPIVLRHNTPGTVSGAVRDAAGHGLGGLEVIVSPAGEFDSSTSVLTATDGSFRVDGLAPGSYRVVTVDPADLRGAPQHYIAEVYDDAGPLESFATSTVVEVDVGASVTLAPIVLDHSDPGVVSGTVVGPGGVPLDGIVAVVLDRDGTVTLGADATGPDGQYTVTGITPGTDHRVRFFDGRTLFGLPPAYRAEHYDDALDIADAAPVAVDAGTVTTLPTVALAPFAP